MKDLSSAIGLYIESSIELAVLPTILHQTQAHTWHSWDRIDGIISPVYIPVREAAIESLEQQALMARAA